MSEVSKGTWPKFWIKTNSEEGEAALRLLSLIGLGADRLGRFKEGTYDAIGPDDIVFWVPARISKRRPGSGSTCASFIDASRAKKRLGGISANLIRIYPGGHLRKDFSLYLMRAVRLVLERQRCRKQPELWQLIHLLRPSVLASRCQALYASSETTCTLTACA